MPSTCIASAAFGPLSFYVRVVLRDGCCVRRSAEPAGDQLEMQNWPSHLSHRRASDVCARLFRLFPGVQNNVTRRGITSLRTDDTPRPPLRYHHRSHPSPRQFSNMQRYVFSPPLIAPRGRCPADGRHHMFHIWSVKVDGDPGTQLWWCFHCRVMWFLRECPQQRAFRGVLNRELIEGYGPGGYIDLDPDSLP